MATVPGSHPAPSPAPVTPPRQEEVRIYSHSSLFYWWPVWAAGFIMAILTGFEGGHMAVVPGGTEAESERKVDGHPEPRDVLVLPANAHLPKDAETKEPIKPKLRVSKKAQLGVIYATVLLIIIVISNVPLRGLWSVVIIMLIVLMVLIFSLAGWWDWILDKLWLLDIRITMGGYVFISLILLIIWALTVFVFDHRTYVIVSSGQVRVCLAIGTGETVYDTTGMTFTKRQDDLFRHWIVGLGSGDLIIHRSNTTQEIDMPNVLFVGSKIKEIEKLIKEREVVS
jgi:hypothetical protein